MNPTRCKVKLARRLLEEGCALDPDDFRNCVTRLFQSRFGSYTIDDVLCSPTEMAAPFCVDVRKDLRLPGLTDRTILRTLLDLRKRSRFPRAMDSGRGSRPSGDPG